MTVKELIEKLKDLPEDSYVLYEYEDIGIMEHADVEKVELDKDNFVILSDTY